MLDLRLWLSSLFRTLSMLQLEFHNPDLFVAKNICLSLKDGNQLINLIELPINLKVLQKNHRCLIHTSINETKGKCYRLNSTHLATYLTTLCFWNVHVCTFECAYMCINAYFVFSSKKNQNQHNDGALMSTFKKNCNCKTSKITQKTKWAYMHIWCVFKCPYMCI